MNGIIHNCTHPKENDPLFRISEEKMFLSMFTYIDRLFQAIKPKKGFFMAVDGKLSFFLRVFYVLKSV